MKKIYFDCGAHFGEGLRYFIDKYKMDETWEIFSFEPNKISFEKLVSDNPLSYATFINKAVWIFDGYVNFNAEYPPGCNDAIGAGSSIMPLDYWHPKSENNPGAGDVFDTYSVQCIDLSNFIAQNSSLGDTVIVKLDVEGSEFDILRKMLIDKTIKRISVLYVEFHDFCYSKESFQSKNELISMIQNEGVPVHGHF